MFKQHEIKLSTLNKLLSLESRGNARQCFCTNLMINLKIREYPGGGGYSHIWAI